MIDHTFYPVNETDDTCRCGEPDWKHPTQELLDRVNESLTKLTNAIWQAYYHCEFDDLITNFHRIDGNDHPVLKKLAADLRERLEDEGWRPV